LELTNCGKALITTLLFRLLFGGYIAGMDQYAFNDFESALTVLLIYGLLGIFAALFLLSNKKSGLLGIIGLDAVFITLQVIFIAVSLCQNIDAGLHDPVSNWWATVLMILFSLLTLFIALKLIGKTRND
jgi:hypothetical protein